MIRILVPLLLTVSLSGCASISYPLPKCDGYSRRPLNRSMWQWEDKEKLQKPVSENARNPASHAVPYAEEQASVTPAAFAQFDVAGSYRSCEGN
jgi:type IV secretion system protein VirB7